MPSWPPMCSLLYAAASQAPGVSQSCREYPSGHPSSQLGPLLPEYCTSSQHHPSLHCLSQVGALCSACQSITEQLALAVTRCARQGQRSQIPTFSLACRQGGGQATGERQAPVQSGRSAAGGLCCQGGRPAHAGSTGCAKSGRSHAGFCAGGDAAAQRSGQTAGPAGPTVMLCGAPTRFAAAAASRCKSIHHMQPSGRLVRPHSSCAAHREDC